MTPLLRLQSLLLALGALTVGAAVYALARPGSAWSIEVARYLPWTAALPTFVHTLAFALLCAVCARTRRSAVALVLLWGLVEMLAELTQIRPSPLPSLHWTFDPADLTAVAIGTGVALFVLFSHADPQHD